MAVPEFSSEQLKTQIDLVRKFQNQPWETVADNEKYQQALAELVEIFGPELGLTTNYEFFRALQNPKNSLLHSLDIFEESEILGEYVDKTEIDNSQVTSLLHEYQEYLAKQAEDQLKKKKRKTTQELVKEILEKQHKTPAMLAAKIAVQQAQRTTPGSTPSNEELKTALRTEELARIKTVEVASRQGTVQVERFADEVLKQVEDKNRLHLTEEEHNNAKMVMMATVLVGALPFSTKPAEFALDEAEADSIKRDLSQAAEEISQLRQAASKPDQATVERLSAATRLSPAQVETVIAESKVTLSPAQLERLQAKQTTAELIYSVLEETTTKKLPSIESINETLTKQNNFPELIERVETNTLQIHEVLIRRQAYYLPPATTSLTEDHAAATVQAYNQTFPDTPVAAFATYQGARVAEAIKKGDVPTKATQGMAVATELYSRGYTTSQFRQFIRAAQADAKLRVSLDRYQPAFRELEKYLTEIERSPLSRDLARGHQSPFMSQYSRLTNQVSFLVPQRFAAPFKILTNPRGWVTQTLGRRAGSYFAGKAASSAALASVKAFALRLGAKTGLASLAAKAGFALGGIGGGPVGWALLAGQAAMAVADKLFRPFLDFIGAKSTGEVITNGVVGGVVLLATLPMLIASAVTLTALVPFAFIGVIGGILFWYIPTINIAPILSTMVQLDSNIGPATNPFTSPFSGPGFTGPMIEGCTPGWPVPPVPGYGRVIQGPHGTYSHSVIEAIDITIPTGTEVVSIFDGQISFNSYQGVYGNLVTVKSQLPNGQQIHVLYAHLANPSPLGVGATVKAGDFIALSDATSSEKNFANPHLHLEYRGAAYNACPAGGAAVPDGCYLNCGNITVR